MIALRAEALDVARVKRKHPREQEINDAIERRKNEIIEAHDGNDN